MTRAATKRKVRKAKARPEVCETHGVEGCKACDWRPGDPRRDAELGRAATVAQWNRRQSEGARNMFGGGSLAEIAEAIAPQRDSVQREAAAGLKDGSFSWGMVAGMIPGMLIGFIAAAKYFS